MKALLLAGAGALLMASPAAAQMQGMDHSQHQGMNMPGMQMPSKPAPKKPQAKAPARKGDATKAKRPAGNAAVRQPKVADTHAGHAMGATQSQAAPDPHAGHDMSSMPGMSGQPDPQAGHAMAQDDPHAGHDMSQMKAQADPHAGHDMAGADAGGEKVGTNLPPGNAPAPAPQPGLAAARFWGIEQMADADRDLRREHGGTTYYQLLLNVAEYQARDGADGYRWDGEAWIGGDINRLTIKSEGEGSFGEPLEQAEIQALYSRALDPYWNLQAGLRYDIKPNPSRAYATIGVEGLAPYWFDVEGALFLSDKGDVLARAEAYYDQRITQNFVLQPRVEANLAAQDVPENGTGSGLTDLEVGLRLRYERTREFAPYVGVSWERQFGDTARLSRARGDDTGGFSFVAGVRTWF